jgi:hypothetical protein
MKTLGVKPVAQLHRSAKEHVIVEIKVTLGQAGDVVNPGLDVARVKCGQGRLGHQITVVHQGQAV